VLDAINSMRDPFRQLRGYAAGGGVDFGGVLPNLAGLLSVPSYLRALPTNLAFASIPTGPALSGTPVHLHLDGQTFQTIAPVEVAQKLASYTRKSNFASLGVSPSWQGAR